MREPHIGDRIQIKSWGWIIKNNSIRTKVWMAKQPATVVRVNKNTLTVRFDLYPAENHYIDYDDFVYI